ncbi:MAG: glycine cleavage system protein GcvH [Myxococcales bacterium]|nr:glycine cleavage system protein GcvH [Myxococcales bacterium]
MIYPTHFKYTDQHEWLHIEGDVATVGITHHAQDQLGDIVHVEFPAVGKSLAKGKSACEIESVKSVSDVYAPISGTVTAVNTTLEGKEAVINADPHGGGWLFKLKISNPAELAELMDSVAYTAIA